MKKAREEDIQEIRKEIEIEIKVTCLVVAVAFIGFLFLLNY